MKKLLAALGLLALTIPAGAVNIPADVLVVPSLAAMQALGTAASQYTNVQTLSYRVGGSIGGAYYTWNASSTTNDCTHIQATGVTTGRFVLRTDLQNNWLIPTQCGAYFDGSADGSGGHDDSAYWQATFDAASAYGLIVGPQAGITKISATLNPHAGVILQGAGMAVETLQCWSNPDSHCLYYQAPVAGTTTYQGPQFRDFSIAGAPGQTLIQINCMSDSAPCGFTDDPSTQGYVDTAIVERVNSPTLDAEAGVYVQMSKCFHCVIRNNSFSTAFEACIQAKGSDFLLIEQNRAIACDATGDNAHAIEVLQAATFGNDDRILHNDISNTRGMSDAYIYSTARSIEIGWNAIEDVIGTPPVSCNIKLQEGFQAYVHDNLTAAFQNAGDSYAGCVNGDFWYWLGVERNGLSTQGLPWLFNNSTGLKYFVTGSAPAIRQLLTHYGNNTEMGIPMNVQGSSALPTGLTIYDSTPDTYLGINGNDYGATVRVIAAGLNGTQAPAWLIPPLAGFGSIIHFYDSQLTLLNGTMSLCFKGVGGNASQQINVQINDNGVSAASATVTLSGGTGALYCPSALQHVVINNNATFDFWNNDTTHAANVYLSEVVVTAG